MRADGQLREGVVALRVNALFVDPRRGAVRRDDGDLAVAGFGTDDVGELAEHVLFLQRVDERALVLVRDKIAAFGIVADLQRVQNARQRRLRAHTRPERRAVLVRRRAFLLITLCRHRLFGDRLGHGAGQLFVQSFLPFQTGDLFAERGDVGFHFAVSCVVFRRQQTVFTAVAVEEGFRLFPQAGSFFSQFVDSHRLNLHKN